MITLARIGLVLGLACAPVPVVAAEDARPDPWKLPTPDLATLLISLTESKREYVIESAAKVPDAARPPERVESASSEEERKSLQSCRDLQQAGKWPEAANSLDVLLKSNPALHEARALAGLSLLRMGRPKEAAAALRDALIGNRRNPEAWKALEEVASALGRKVVRPYLQPQSWLSPGKGDAVQIWFTSGNAGGAKGDGMPAWACYALARAWYRYEGGYAADFPGEAYRFTFREVLHGVGAMLQVCRKSRADGEELPDDLRRLMAEEDAGTIVPFAFFALYVEPLPAKEIGGFDLLRPRLVRYFDERILSEK